MGASTTFYTLVSEQPCSATPSGLLTGNGSANSSLTWAVRQLQAGDVIIVRAFARFSTGPAGAAVRFRLYFNPTADITAVPIADSGTQNLQGSVALGEIEFYAMLTVRRADVNGFLYCDGWLAATSASGGVVQVNLGGAGPGAPQPINTQTMPNLMELTATVSGAGAMLDLEQCSIEYLATP
jgi:hypothetical protein